jgi:hypothetical protein
MPDICDAGVAIGGKRMSVMNRQVDCDCDPLLTRSVLQPMSSGGCFVNACLRCGRVCVTRQLVREPHPHDLQIIGHELLAMPFQVLDWLAGWPRCARPATAFDWVFLSPALRCADTDSLAAEAAAATAAQQGCSRVQRLRMAGVPGSPAPELPPDLSSYADAWTVLQDPAPAPRVLLELLQHAPAGRAIWIDSLAADTAMHAELARGLDDPAVSEAAWQLVWSLKLASAEVLATLARQIESAREPLQARAAAQLALELGRRSPALDAAIRAAALRFGGSDRQLQRVLAQLLRRMR